MHTWSAYRLIFPAASCLRACVRQFVPLGQMGQNQILRALTPPVVNKRECKTLRAEVSHGVIRHTVLTLTLPWMRPHFDKGPPTHQRNLSHCLTGCPCQCPLISCHCAVCCFEFACSDVGHVLLKGGSWFSQNQFCNLLCSREPSSMSKFAKPGMAHRACVKGGKPFL